MANSEADDTLIKDAKQRFTEAYDADRENRERGFEDAEFEAGNGRQWPPEVRKQREEQGSLCLEFNHLRGFVRQVSNELRMQPPGINVSAAQDGDPSIAIVIEGLIRSIERNSRAQRAYAKAGEDACRCNMGFLKVTKEYEDPSSFDQVLKVKHVINPFSVLYDPACEDSTCRDARYCFIYDDMPRDEFKAKYKDKVVSEFYDVREHGDGAWITQDTVRLAEYWVVEETQAKLLLFDNGRTAWADDKAALKAIKAEGALQKSERTSTRRQVRMHLLSGQDVLETSEWEGDRIPIIPVWGEEARVGARRVRNGVISFAKDAQKLINFARSSMAEKIALAPKAPWLVTSEMIKGYEPQWASASKGNPFVLPYNYDGQAGRPERIQPASIETGLVQMAAVADDDLKATIGIYDASLGAKSNETSGIAITARQKEGDVGTFAFIDNVMEAIEEVGRVFVDMIPHVYDASRELRILGKDMEPAIVKVNQSWVQPNPDGTLTPMPVIDLTVGKYDVAVSTGPSVTTQRVETSQTLTSALQAAPNLAPIILPRLAALMNLPDADEFAQEVKQVFAPQQQGPSPKDQATLAQAQSILALNAAKTDAQRLDNAAKAAELHQMAAAIANPAPAAGPGIPPGAPGAPPGTSDPGFQFQKTSWVVS